MTGKALGYRNVAMASAATLPAAQPGWRDAVNRRLRSNAALISASFGTVVGDGLNHILPGADIAVGAFAVVAMAATFGAATQATFAAIVFISAIATCFARMASRANCQSSGSRPCSDRARSSRLHRPSWMRRWQQVRATT